MTYPIVYDVLIRQEVEARNPKEALRDITETLVSGATSGLHSAFEVIRDDNKHPPKDYISRQSNGFAVFTSVQKQQLLGALKDALDAASKGNPAPGEQLLATLHRQFDYMTNDTLIGVTI